MEMIRRILGLVLVLMLVGGSTALAGDPQRYADRAAWPDWAATYYNGNRQFPMDGELVDAIRFELIRGYPIAPQDYMKYEDREFRPHQAMTRAEFAAVLSRSQALATADGEGANWYVPYVTALKEAGIIPAGASEEWGAAISRREAGQWMGRAANLFEADDRDDGPTFTDVDDPLILRAVRAGIVKGVGEGRFEPDRSLLRVEAAVMLLRLARARNAGVDPAVVGALQAVIKEADRQATERGRRWVEQGYFDTVEAGGVLTQEMVDYLINRVRDNLEVRQGPPKSWGVTPEASYVFEVLELHETVAVLGLCALGQAYRATDPPGQPWFERQYCGRQFLVLREGVWLVSGAADPASTSGGNQ